MQRAFIPAILWVDQPVQFRIVEGVACCTIYSGDESMELRGTIGTMVGAMASASRAYAGFAASKGAEVVGLRKRKRHKH